MNIKSLANIFTPTPVTRRNQVARGVKAEESSDRDANGQQAGGDSAEKRKLSAEEIALAVKHLKELSGVRDHHLQVVVREQNGLSIVFIEDLQGKVIRRIPEWELIPLLLARENATGQLLNRTL